MAFADVNFLAIILAAIAAFGWGALYYTTLSAQWLRAVGMSKEQMQTKRTVTPFIISFVAELVMAWILAGAMGHLGAGKVTVMSAITWGLLLWLGFIVTTVFVNNAYPGRKVSLSVIDSIHWLGVVVIQGAVIGAMGI